MIDSIGDFVVALRRADIAVSPAETLEAVSAIQLIGPGNRQLMHDTLALILAKSPEEKAQFDVCFERFFSFRHFEKPTAVHRRRHESVTGEFSDTGGKTGEKLDDVGALNRTGDELAGTLAHHQSRLGHLLLAGDSNELAVLMTHAARAVHLERMRTLRERRIFTRRILLHMGLPLLEEETARLGASASDRDGNTAARLTAAREALIEEVRGFVDEQYGLIVDGKGGRFIADAVSEVRLTSMQSYYFGQIRETVRKLATRLAKRHAKRRKIVNRGQLDIRRTLRSNLQYDGALFDLKWKQTRIERPRVFVVCDVSGSVRVVSRFLLTFLYSLGEVLPNVRAFAFSNALGEVTDIFRSYPLDDAIDMSLDDHGKGSTDYGCAFNTFAKIALNDIDNRSTVIILGDSRNNFYATGSDALRRIAGRARQVIWLNPEPRDKWNEGDAEMSCYLPFCDVAEVCNSLDDLERIVSRVLKSAH